MEMAPEHLKELSGFGPTGNMWIQFDCTEKAESGDQSSSKQPPRSFLDWR